MFKFLCVYICIISIGFGKKAYFTLPGTINLSKNDLTFFKSPYFPVSVCDKVNCNLNISSENTNFVCSRSF